MKYVEFEDKIFIKSLRESKRFQHEDSQRGKGIL